MNELLSILNFYKNRRVIKDFTITHMQVNSCRISIIYPKNKFSVLTEKIEIEDTHNVLIDALLDFFNTIK